MWKWNMFLPEKPVCERVSLVRPRLGQLEETDSEERLFTDQQVFAAYTNWQLYADELHDGSSRNRGPYNSYEYDDMPTDASDSSGHS